MKELDKATFELLLSAINHANTEFPGQLNQLYILAEYNGQEITTIPTPEVPKDVQPVALLNVGPMDYTSIVLTNDGTVEFACTVRGAPCVFRFPVCAALSVTSIDRGTGNPLGNILLPTHTLYERIDEYIKNQEESEEDKSVQKANHLSLVKE